MFTAVVDSFARFLRLFRRTSPFPVEILVPGLLILFSWPLLRIWLDDPRTTFMVAFSLGMGLRLAMKSEVMIRRLRARFSGRATVILVLALGPGVMASLIFCASPILCQRFLSLWFLIAAALYVIDIIDGDCAISRYRWPEPAMRATDATMTRAMAVYNLAMVLVNETVIHQASQTTWLMYFGALPLFTNIIRTALVRTVTEGLVVSRAR